MFCSDVQPIIRGTFTISTGKMIERVISDTPLYSVPHLELKLPCIFASEFQGGYFAGVDLRVLLPQCHPHHWTIFCLLKCGGTLSASAKVGGTIFTFLYRSLDTLWISQVKRLLLFAHDPRSWIFSRRHASTILEKGLSSCMPR